MTEFKSFYKVVGGNEGSKCHYPARLDLYGCGCEHDCKYCYAKSLLSFRKLWNPSEPAVADLKKVKECIAKLDPKQIIRLGGLTDCFMPREKFIHNTYNAIKLLNAHGNGYLIVTKSALVADDEYMAILDKNKAHIQITVTTSDDDLAKTYEKASKPSDRIKAILKLQEAGFDVQIRLSPYIPQFWDLDKLKGYGINKALVEFLRVNTWVKRWFKIDYSEYKAQSIGYKVGNAGYRHLPLKKKVEYLKPLLSIFKEVSVCEDNDTAYRYWQNNINPNKNDCCNLRL